MPGWEDVCLVVIARDEERNIGACLGSAPRCGRRLVIDGGSRDGTIAAAEAAGAEVVRNEWPGYSAQYNFAFAQVRSPWTLLLDADERLSPALEAEMGRTLGALGADAYDVPRANYFCGQWMRYGGWYPDYQTRLFRTGLARYEARAVHSRLIVSGVRAQLQSPLEHYSYGSVADWVRKINGYTSLEVRNKDMDFAQVQDEWAGYDLKMKLKYRLRRAPGRPLLRFLWMYVWNQGFRDGRRGLALAVLSAFYEYLAAVKYEEAHGWGRGEPVRAESALP